MTTAEVESVIHGHQIAFHFFRNEAIAEEVSQEVFMQLFEGHRNIETGSHCLPGRPGPKAAAELLGVRTKHLRCLMRISDPFKM